MSLRERFRDRSIDWMLRAVGKHLTIDQPVYSHPTAHTLPLPRPRGKHKGGENNHLSNALCPVPREGLYEVVSRRTTSSLTSATAAHEEEGSSIHTS